MHQLKIPDTLLYLEKMSLYPERDRKVYASESPLVTKENLKKVLPEEDEFHFLALPLQTVREAAQKSPNFWKEFGALDQIDPDLALILADFAIGADSCLILDYRENKEDPAVLYLAWGEKNKWIKVADNFHQLCLMLEII